MRTALALHSFRFTVLSGLGLLHGCGGSVAPGPTRNTSEGTDQVPNGGAGVATTGSTTAGGGSRTVTGAGGGAGAAPMPNMPVSPGSAPVVMSAVCDGTQTDVGAGLFECANGLVHRVEAVTCTMDPPRPEPVQDRINEAAVVSTEEDGSVPPQSLDLSTCTYDADCTESPYGRCDAYADELNHVVSYCWYGSCRTDADCGDGRACVCNGASNQCTSAQCRTDADCSDDNVCARFAYDSCGGVTVFYACTSSTDGCRRNEDCGDVETGATCFPSWDPAMPGAVCGGTTCSEGRPFLVDGVARVAALETRTDWTLPQCPKLLELTDADRLHLAGEWQRTALAEHASIAAFARFALDLLAVGAPPELLEQTQQAMRDETLHAKLAFGLASGYAGRGIGPGPLSCDGALDAHDLGSIARNTVLEGCIGETLAALDAQHALEHCVDPVVRAVLEQIAKDEAQHAELAWRFVQWALSQDPSLAAGFESLVQSELANARRSAARSARLGTEWTRAHGVLPESDRAALRLSALEQVVVPCLRALSATVRSDATHHAERACSVALGATVA